MGKAETALQRAATVFRLDDRAQLAIADADPNRLVAGERPVLIDEWQRLPGSWDVVRRAVDANPEPGQFLLTGSATPIAEPTHSGAGRIATVRMRPMSLAERGAQPAVRLGELLTGARPPVGGSSDMSLERYTDEIVSSGFPGVRSLTGRLLRVQLDGYLSRIVERDFEELGRPVRNEAALMRWMVAYAAAVSTTASYETIRDAATSGEGDKPAKTTTIPYRDVLERLWIIDDVPAWLPSGSLIRRLAAAPKHQFADPALAARLLGAGAEALLDARPLGPVIPRHGPLLGALFESLATLSVRVYAQAAEARVMHLRTRGAEHEVDLIVERADRRVLGVEVKLARTVDDGDVRHLRWLAGQLGGNLLDMVVITTGPEAYRRRDGVAVVPLALLGP